MVNYSNWNKNAFISVIRTPGRRRVIVLTGVGILCLAILFSSLGAAGVFNKESSQAEVNGNEVRTATASAHELRCFFQISQPNLCFLLRGEPSRMHRRPAHRTVRLAILQTLSLTFPQLDPQ